MPAKLPDTEYQLDNSKRQLLENNIGFIHYMTNTILNIYPDIPRDQYDDIFQDCTIDFIKCLKEFDSSKSKITSYTGKKMISEHNRRIDRYYKRKNVLGEYFFDDIINSNLEDSKDTLEVLDVLSGTYDFEDNVIHNILIQDILNQLENKFSSRNLKIINLHMSGIEQTKIAKMYNITSQRVNQIISRFRKEAQKLMIANGIYQ